MAAFPDYKILTSTSVSRDAGRRTAVAEGGQIRGRNAYEADVYRIHVVMALTETERTALYLFYTNNSDSFNTITIDSFDYSAIFQSAPETTGKAGTYRNVEFDLLGNLV